jgi:hypothetical protein
LAERHQIGERGFTQPAPTRDEFVSEIADMRNWAAETGQPKPGEHSEHFKGRAFWRLIGIGRLDGRGKIGRLAQAAVSDACDCSVKR